MGRQVEGASGTVSWAPRGCSVGDVPVTSVLPSPRGEPVASPVQQLTQSRDFPRKGPGAGVGTSSPRQMQEPEQASPRLGPG